MNSIVLYRTKLKTNMTQKNNFNDNKHKQCLKSKMKKMDDQKTKNMKETTQVFRTISKGDIDMMKDIHEDIKNCCFDLFKKSDDDDITVVATFEIDEDGDDFFTN